MTRILTLVLSAHWMVIFSLSAFAGGWASEGGSPAALGTAVPVTVGLAIVAALFLWLLLSTLMEGPARSRETEAVARIAFSAAVVASTGVFALGGVVPAYGGDMSGLQLAALLCSFLAVQAECRLPAVDAPTLADGVSQARRNAAGAARLSNIGRPSMAGEGR